MQKKTDKRPVPVMKKLARLISKDELKAVAGACGSTPKADGKAPCDDNPVRC